MDRKKIIFKNVSLGVVYKIINMGIVFTTIPLLLNYLEQELYGVWVTIFSLVNIVLFVDGGIGNGLKTKLCEALSNKQFLLAKKYISTAYISISIISIVILFIGAIFIFNFNLQELFNTNLLTNLELQKILFLTLVLVLVGFVLNLYKSFYYANQQASKVELAMLIYQTFILLIITFLLNFFPTNLFFIATLYGASNIIIGFIFTIYFFKKNKKIKPSINFFSKDKINDLMGLSIAFFVIQLCMIVIFTTDNLIISKLIGPSEVTNYDIVYKIFQLIITFSVLMQDPLWALYTDAYQKSDFKWVKKTIIKLNKLFIVLIFIVTAMYFFAKPLIKFWTQRELLISENLLFFMSIFTLVRVFGAIYMIFLNAIGKIKIQMYLFILGAIINIPLSIYFVRYVNLGSSGVILGTIISILLLSIILPIQTFKILKKNEID